MNQYLQQRDTTYVKDNLLFNYLLGNEQTLLLESYIRNNKIPIHFSPDTFYFFMTGTHKKFIAPYTPETFSNGVDNIYRVYDSLKSVLIQHGYDGNVFLIKQDNSKQVGVIFSPKREVNKSPREIAERMHQCYHAMALSSKYISTSFVGPYSGYEQVHQAFRDARVLNDLLFFGLKDCVITKTLREQTSRPCDITAILANIRALINAICSGTQKKAIAIADYLIDEMVAPSYTMLSFYTVKNSVDDILIMLETVYPERVLLYRYPAQHFYLLSDYKQYLHETLHKVFSQLKGLHRYTPNILMALSYINRNYINPLSLAQLSDYVYSNPSSFSGEFNAQVGVSLSEYISGLRLRHAQRLLIKTDKSVADVAGMSGFTSVKYFRQVFKKQVGLTPLEYREKELQHLQKNS